MAAGSTASGVMPACASSAMRRGLSLASTSGTLISPKSISDATFGQVVRSHLDHHLVAGQHTDAVLAHLAGGMGDDHVIIGDQLHAEVRVWEEFFHDPLELQHFFFGQWVLLKPFASRGDRRERAKKQAFPTVFHDFTAKYLPPRGPETAVSTAASAGPAP